MSGEKKGVAAQIIKKYPKAPHTHCAAHRLNSCIVQYCSNQLLHKEQRNCDDNGLIHESISFNQFSSTH